LGTFLGIEPPQSFLNFVADCHPFSKLIAKWLLFCELTQKNQITTMKHFLPILLIFMVLSACETEQRGSAEQSYAGISDDSAIPLQRASASPNRGNEPIDDRKVIWTGDLDLQVKNVEESSNKIKDITKEFGGFISDMNLSNSNYEISNLITVKIENNQFQALIDAIKKEAVFIKNIGISSTDVTEEFIDIQSRLKTKKEVRERYIDILKNKTGSVKDVLEAEEAIRVITEEIEAKEGRLRYLENRVKFSTLRIRIYQEVSYEKEPAVFKKSYADKATEALGNGWSIITTFVLFLLNIWPLLFVAFGGFMFWKWRKSQSKN